MRVCREFTVLGNVLLRFFLWLVEWVDMAALMSSLCATMIDDCPQILATATTVSDHNYSLSRHIYYSGIINKIDVMPLDRSFRCIQ